MRRINFEFKTMCKKIKQGSFTSRSNRHSSLQQCANQLYDLGYKLPSATSLKPKHIEALIAKWKGDGLSPGTLKNRMVHIRWWAKQVGKESILKKSNADYGIEERKRTVTHRGFSLSPAQLQQVTDPRVRLALQLQSEFGLRKEKALKLRPSVAFRKDVLTLKASWTKGGRKRVIPITNEGQRRLLAYASALCGSGSLIPADKSYIQFVNRYYAQTKKAGITNPHGLRHAYAQRRYVKLTGGMLPPALGGKARADMTSEAKRKDRLARKIISEELGHSRLEVTNVYLGGAR